MGYLYKGSNKQGFKGFTNTTKLIMADKISLNAEELSGFLEYIYNNNQLLVSKHLPAQTVNVEGEAGGGKTSVILQFAKKHGMELIERI